MELWFYVGINHSGKRSAIKMQRKSCIFKGAYQSEMLGIARDM